MPLIVFMPFVLFFHSARAISGLVSDKKTQLREMESPDFCAKWRTSIISGVRYHTKFA
jgi:hypothetical protein